MYKVASDKAQAGVRRFKLHELCTREFEPSDEERRENLKAKVKALTDELLTLDKKHPRRADLGQEISRLNAQMNAIRPKWKGPDLSDCLLKTIRASVTKHQWAMWVKEAEDLLAEGATMAAEADSVNRKGDYMRLYIICPVRNCPAEITERIRAYAVERRADGHEVHFPTDDVNQDDPTGAGIVLQHLSAMRKADQVHVFWDVESKGSHFDLGMAYALGKEVVPVECIHPDSSGKSYWKVMQG